MLISLFLLAQLSLISAPVFTAKVMSEVYQKEKAQIAADNALIELGRSDRSTLKFLEQSNEVLKKWHTAHHGFHACALVPQTAAVCFPKDKFLEAGIRMHLETARATALIRWKGVRTMLAAKLGGVFSRRFGELKLTSIPCGECSLPLGWEVDESLLHSQVSSYKWPVKAQSVMRKNPWQYELLP